MWVWVRVMRDLACEMSSLFEIPLLRYCETFYDTRMGGREEDGIPRDASSSTSNWASWSTSVAAFMYFGGIRELSLDTHWIMQSTVECSGAQAQMFHSKEHGVLFSSPAQRIYLRSMLKVPQWMSSSIWIRDRE